MNAIRSLRQGIAGFGIGVIATLVVLTAITWAAEEPSTTAQSLPKSTLLSTSTPIITTATPLSTSTPQPPIPTPDPTKEMQKSIEAVAYIMNYEYKVEFDYLCDDYHIQKRIWDWEKDLTRFELRATNKDYQGTPKWHMEIRGLAEELESLVRLIDRHCLE